MKKVMLLVSENMCDVLQTALKDKYELLPCSDPAAAREVLDQAPDALILYLFLPGANSLIFLRENASVLPPVVIALTNFFSNFLLQELAMRGVSAVIRIPFPPDYLERQLTALL